MKKVYHKIYDTFMFNDKTSIKKRKCVFITTELYLKINFWFLKFKEKRRKTKIKCLELLKDIQ